MMIERHLITALPEIISNRYEETTQALVRNIEMFKLDYYSRKATVYYNNLKEAFAYSIFLGLSKDDSYTCLFYSLQFGLNHFKLSSTPNKSREIEIGRTLINVQGKTTNDYIDFSTWMTVFYMAVILKDQNAIHFLVHLENRFMEHGNVSYDQVRIAEVEVYKMLYNNPNHLKTAIGIYEKKEREFSKTDPSRDWIDYQGTPVISLCSAINNSDTGRFNDLLYEALLKHKAYYGKKNKVNDFWGWVSLPLLMICSYAYDRGIDIQIESEYIPRWIIEGDFKNCELSIK